ncbi:ROK family protein [Pseudolactococcus plantarum]|uniref:Sugar kinase and transcription regulator n=1 Tax=Pseudolactococcus plantarum TaxID=1365 RepID=A0A2A5S2C9_9LACT|nr:ROK family protein [Lactococcus plantarum]PCS07687.1 sugar kinase and transcription regulator [Lactococcus plantarum]HCN75110.1 ROK family protein [Lactococcus sp.]
MYYIGFDIGGTAIKYGLVNHTGEVFHKGTFPTILDDADKMINQMSAKVKKIQANYEIQGVGVSIPGIVSPDGYMITAGSILSLYHMHLKKRLESAFGLPVTLENDANCVAIAEQWVGNAKGVENYIVVTLGTAVGCGIVINNQIYKGAHGAAGEAGWSMQESLDYTQDLEDNSWNFTSGVIVGLCRHYQHESGKTISDARMILDLASHGDEIAGRVLDQYYDDVAKGLLNLICVFDPEVLLIGGGISANQSFLRHLSHRLDKIKLHHRSLNRLSNDTIAQVQPCLLKNDAGLIGAVYQVIKEKEKEMNRSSL